MLPQLLEPFTFALFMHTEAIAANANWLKNWLRNELW